MILSSVTFILHQVNIYRAALLTLWKVNYHSIISLLQQNISIKGVFEQLSHIRVQEHWKLAASAAQGGGGGSTKVRGRESWRRQEKLIGRSYFNSHVFLSVIWRVWPFSCWIAVLLKTSEQLQISYLLTTAWEAWCFSMKSVSLHFDTGFGC